MESHGQQAKYVPSTRSVDLLLPLPFLLILNSRREPEDVGGVLSEERPLILLPSLSTVLPTVDERRLTRRPLGDSSLALSLPGESVGERPSSAGDVDSDTAASGLCRRGCNGGTLAIGALWTA